MRLAAWPPRAFTPRSNSFAAGHGSVSIYRSFACYRAATARETTGILLLCALSGVVWYFQFFFYGMGSTKIGAYDFSSWTLHMAFIIIFGNIWGLGFRNHNDSWILLPSPAREKVREWLRRVSSSR